MGVCSQGVNVFLRDCLYNVYLRDQHCLVRSEAFLEIPLDSIVAAKICELGYDLPRWTTIKALDYATNEKYQRAFECIAKAKGCSRVHIDAVLQGARKEEPDAEERTLNLRF